MFDDYSLYPKERVRLFFKYVANAARRHHKRSIREDLLTGFGPEIVSRDIAKYRPQERPERKVDLSEERKEELETKVDVYYTNNKYLPIEMKLKKLKRRISPLRKEGVSKTKINSLKEKLIVCEKLLKEIKKSEVSGH